MPMSKTNETSNDRTGRKLQTPGIAARVFGELADVKIRMISQGASEINLTFVVEEDTVSDIVQRLHKAFFSDLDPEVFA